MLSKINAFGIINLLPYAAILLCTILGAGESPNNCILPLLLILPYIVRHKKQIENHRGHIIGILLIFTGFVAVAVTTADRQNSFYEFEKLFCLIFSFCIGLTVSDENDIFKYITISAALTAFIGLCGYCGFIRADGVVFNDRYILRLQSFPGYANTTALLLGLGYFSAISLYLTYEKKYIAYIASGILIAFYLTVSKAAILIFPILGTLLFIKEKKYSRIFILQNLICMLFALLIVSAGFKQWQTIKFILIIACIVSGGGISERRSDFSHRKAFIALWCAGLGIFASSAFAIFLTKNINIAETLFKRFDYMKDALMLLGKHFPKGIGPGAWKYYQYSIQTTQYDVAYIHNSWLQLLLEYGAVFFTLFAILTAFTVITFLRKKQYCLCTLILFISLHSFIDINFGFGLVLMIIGLLFGLAFREFKAGVSEKHIFRIILLMCCIMLGYTVCTYTLQNRFEAAYVQKNNKKAMQYAQLLRRLCPLDSRLHITIAALGDDELAEKEIELAKQLSPLDREILEADIEYSISHKQTEILKKCENYIKSAPLLEKTYHNAEKYADRILSDELCTRDEYDKFLSYLNSERDKFGVANRNVLFEEITK